MCRAFPGVPPTLDRQRGFRDPDDVAGGTAGALFKVLAKHGHDVVSKIEVARRIAASMDVEANRSRSFQVFRDGIRRLVA